MKKTIFQNKSFVLHLRLLGQLSYHINTDEKLSAPEQTSTMNIFLTIKAREQVALKDILSSKSTSPFLTYKNPTQVNNTTFCPNRHDLLIFKAQISEKLLFSVKFQEKKRRCIIS